MGFFSRLFTTRPARPDAQASLPSIIEIPADHDDDDAVLDASTVATVLAEIDIDSAISAHEAWKQRLKDYLNGASSEQLDPAVICQDDRCQLGQWLHGTGSQRLGHHPAFSILISRHRYFHEQAAAVVSQAQAGNTDMGRQILSGSYRYASSQVVLLLKELKRGLGR